MKNRQSSRYAIPVMLFSLVLSTMLFHGLADASQTPIKKRVTNVRDTRFTVTWVTTDSTVGQISYGTSTGELDQTADDDRGSDTEGFVHHVTITGLLPNTSYYYEIVSGDITDNNDGAYYAITTGPDLIPVGSCQPGGRVFLDSEYTEQALDTIVYVSFLDDEDQQDSSVSSMVVTASTSGYWYSELINSRTQDRAELYSYTCGSGQILVEAEGGNQGRTEMTVTPIDISDSAQSPMVLAVLSGDADMNGTVDLGDVITALGTVSGGAALVNSYKADTDGDDRIGLTDAVHVMHEISQ